MVKVKIEIDLGSLVPHEDHHEEHEEKKILPTVPVDFDNQRYLNNQKTWYQTYSKGGSKWIRIEGRGESPSECEDIIIRMSPGNTDELIDEEMVEIPGRGMVMYDDFSGNMYVQAVRLQQLRNQGYSVGDTNFVEELVD